MGIRQRLRNVIRPAVVFEEPVYPSEANILNGYWVRKTPARFFGFLFVVFLVVLAFG